MLLALILFNIFVLCCVIFIILDNKQPSLTWAWILIIIFLPVFGIILYLFLGKNHRYIKSTYRKIVKISENINLNKSEKTSFDNLFFEDNEIRKDLKKNYLNSKVYKLSRLLRFNSHALLTNNNSIKILQNGKISFPQLINDIKNAKYSINMAFFIWEDDSFTQEVKKLLIKKAKEGVTINILLDALGCFPLHRKYKKELINNGIKVYTYFDFKSLFTLHTINYRNHRKIVIIDGIIGYTGGMNMGKEYIDGGKRYKSWRDTMIKIEGDGAVYLQVVFAIEWENTTKKYLIGEKYFPKLTKHYGNTVVQILTSGPDSEWLPVQQMYFEMISLAKKSIYIQSPYFIPDEAIFEALIAAALSGVDVKIMKTGVPDKLIVHWSAFTFYKKLLKAGVKIYHYNAGFLHSKAIMVDDEICAIGSANFDVRSFFIDYELMAVMYDKKIAEEYKVQFEKDLKVCSQMTLRKYNKISSLCKFRNSIARLFSPLL